MFPPQSASTSQALSFRLTPIPCLGIASSSRRISECYSHRYKNIKERFDCPPKMPSLTTPIIFPFQSTHSHFPPRLIPTPSYPPKPPNHPKQPSSQQPHSHLQTPIPTLVPPTYTPSPQKAPHGYATSAKKKCQDKKTHTSKSWSWRYQLHPQRLLALQEVLQEDAYCFVRERIGGIIEDCATCR